jgi:hypothetical protein
VWLRLWLLLMSASHPVAWLCGWRFPSVLVQLRAFLAPRQLHGTCLVHVLPHHGCCVWSTVGQTMAGRWSMWPGQPLVKTSPGTGQRGQCWSGDRGWVKRVLQDTCVQRLFSLRELLSCHGLHCTWAHGIPCMFRGCVSNALKMLCWLSLPCAAYIDAAHGSMQTSGPAVGCSMLHCTFLADTMLTG